MSASWELNVEVVHPLRELGTDSPTTDISLSLQGAAEGGKGTVETETTSKGYISDL
jgi:hypothetical protein